MAKESKPAPAKNNTKTWLIAAVAVIVVILLIVWGKKGAEAPAAAPAPEVPAPEAAPVEAAPEVAPAEAAPADVPEGAMGKEYDRELGVTGNAEIVDSTVTWKAAGGQPVTKEEGMTFFESISCQHAVGGSDADKNTQKEDTVSFSFTNKGKKTYHLYYVKYGSAGYEDAMRVNVNGRRIRDVEKACGQMDIAPGETVSCSGAAALLRSGESYTGKELVNIFQAETMDYIDNVVFKC